MNNTNENKNESGHLLLQAMAELLNQNAQTIARLTERLSNAEGVIVTLSEKVNAIDGEAKCEQRDTNELDDKLSDLESRIDDVERDLDDKVSGDDIDTAVRDAVRDLSFTVTVD